LNEFAPGIDPHTILSKGATALEETASPPYLQGVKLAFNEVLARSYQAATVVAAVYIFGALAMK
jgi:hypothetical protein